jgi:hypothetical protein
MAISWRGYKDDYGADRQADRRQWKWSKRTYKMEGPLEGGPYRRIG